jgi:hypothetical protein
MDFSNTQTKLAGWTRVAVRPAAMLLAAGLLAAGCSSLGGSSSPKASGTTPSGSVPFGDRISALFGGGTTQSDAATQAAATSTTPTADDIECPPMDIRQGASTLLVNASGDGSDAMALRYQGTFVRAARECRVQNGQLSIKIGVQGRLVLGPAGVPGDVTVPVRLALVKETLSDSTPLWTKLYMVPATISPSLANVEFTTISEDLSMPLPKPEDLEQMTIYIGFDPAGAEMEKRKRPAPKAAKPRRTSAR